MFFVISDFSSICTTPKLPYDIGSVMHYGFGVITSDPYFQYTVGQRWGTASFLDLKQVNAHYCGGTIIMMAFS